MSIGSPYRGGTRPLAPHVLAGKVGRFGALRERLIRRSGNPQLVDKFLSGYLDRIVQHFTERYAATQKERLARITELREKLTATINTASPDSGSHAATITELRQIYRAIEAELRGLQSPEAYWDSPEWWESPGGPAATGIAKPHPDPRPVSVHPSPIELLRTNVDAMQGAIDVHWNELKRREADALSIGETDRAADYRRQRGHFETWVRERGGAANIARELHTTIQGTPSLHPLADQSAALRELFLAYHSKERTYPFSDYPRRRRSETKGFYHEQVAAFTRKDGQVWAKPPGQVSSRKGTDGIYVDFTDMNARVKTIIAEVKGVAQETLYRAGAITRNLVDNILDDVHAFFANPPDSPADPEGALAVAKIREGMENLRSAANEIEQIPEVMAAKKGGKYDPEKIGAKPVQERINAVLEKHHCFRKIIDNAGTIKNLSDYLQKSGVSLDEPFRKTYGSTDTE
jgi:hypothetical protein